eukprot:791160-Pyramimonas_sp.AAC.1
MRFRVEKRFEMLRVACLLHPVPILLLHLPLGHQGKELALVAFRRSIAPVHEGLSPKDEDPFVGAVVRHRCPYNSVQYS